MMIISLYFYLNLLVWFFLHIFERMCTFKAHIVFLMFYRQFKPKTSQIVIDFNSINKFGNLNNTSE